MIHKSSNEFSPSLPTIEDTGDNTDDTLRQVYVRAHPTHEYPEGKIEYGWWIIDRVMHDDYTHYVVAKSIEADGSGLLTRIIPTHELENLQSEVSARSDVQPLEAGYMIASRFGSEDSGHQVPATFESKVEAEDTRP